MPTNAAATGFWTAQNRNNALQGRTLLQGLYLATNTGGSNPVPLSSNRTGVLCTSDFGANIFDLRVTVTSGLTMSVKPGTAVIDRPGVGPYEGWLRPGAVSVTCDPAPASNPRNDIVVMRVYDVAQGDTVPPSGPVQIEIVTGTPGAVPVDPVNVVGAITAWPTGVGGVGIALARAQVSTAGVITLTDVRRSTGLLGAVRPMLPGDLSADGSNCQGDLRWNPVSKTVEVYNDSGGWQQVKTSRDSAYLEVRANANQTLANASGANKLTLATVVRNLGIPWSGNNTATLPADGQYAIYCSAAAIFAAGNNFGAAIHGTSAPAAGTAWHSSPAFNTGTTDTFTSNTRWFAAGTQICPYAYNNGSAVTLNPASPRPAEFIIHKIP